MNNQDTYSICEVISKFKKPEEVQEFFGEIFTQSEILMLLKNSNSKNLIYFYCLCFEIDIFTFLAHIYEKDVTKILSNLNLHHRIKQHRTKTNQKHTE